MHPDQTAGVSATIRGNGHGPHPDRLDRTALAQHISDLLHGRRRGEGFQCHCPTHDDKRASLSLDLGSDGRILLYCHAGCDFDSIADQLERMGVSRVALAPAPTHDGGNGSKRANGKARIAVTYDYRDAEGKLIYQTVRLEPKGFYQRRPDGRGGWINNLHGVSPLPYRLPEMLAAIRQGRPIAIVEGEKDADRLASLGLAATCNHGGAGKWLAGHSAFLKGASDVVILPDNDEAGLKHAESVAASLAQTGMRRIRLVALPGLPPKGDISNWLDAGHSLEELQRLIAGAPIRQTSLPGGPQVGVSGWRLLSAEDVLAMPPIRWLIEGEIPAGGLTVLYGDSGSGKSFLALDYALRVAQDANVVYVAGEGLAGYPDRLLAWRNHHRQPLGGFHLVDEAIPMLDDLAVTGFVAAVTPLQPRLIVIDTLARAMLGGDENSARDMGLFIAACNRIQHETGAAVLVVHHTGKNRSGERGSSALRGGADSMIELSNDDGLISLTCAKSKDNEPFKTRYMRLIKVATRDGRDSCVLLPAEAVALTNHLSDGQQRALDVLNWETFVKAGCTARILAEQARIPSGSVYRVLNTLMKLGYVSQASKGEPYFITGQGQAALKEPGAQQVSTIGELSRHYRDSPQEMHSCQLSSLSHPFRGDSDDNASAETGWEHGQR